jgi:hypothetical protein
MSKQEMESLSYGDKILFTPINRISEITGITVDGDFYLNNVNYEIDKWILLTPYYQKI